MANPILSVVIANYNYGRFLEEAILSVISQGMGDKVELIICDAASTDNSVEIIKKYADHVAWWCSEKDGGQSAAFNKGFAYARGEWLTWLNADDLLLPGTLKALFNAIRKHPKAEWITGNKLSFDSGTRMITQVNWGPHSQPPLIRGRRAFPAVFGPTTFFRKSLYGRMGPIDERLHYAMDSEYWARLTLARIRQTRLNHLCWGFRIHEESKTAGEQNDIVMAKRKAETKYWHDKLGYRFKVGVGNIWYLLWVLWRVFDGSWVKRGLLKHTFEGRPIDALLRG